MSEANFSRTLAISPSHISYQACAPHSFHISMNVASPCIERLESAPSEQLFKYVLRCKMGNSARYAISSGCSMALGAGKFFRDPAVVMANVLLCECWLSSIQVAVLDFFVLSILLLSRKRIYSCGEQPRGLLDLIF